MKFKVPMPRIDDYEQARDLAAQTLREKSPRQVAAHSGADIVEGDDNRLILRLAFLNGTVSLQWPACRFVSQEDMDLSIQQEVLLLHYFNGARGTPLTGRWIGYQEVPDGRFYLDAFVRRAKQPLVGGFGAQPERLLPLAATLYGATPAEGGDVAVQIRALPHVPVVLLLWRGDEEFSPEGNILFDAGIVDILSAEDIAWLAGMVIYPLVGMARRNNEPQNRRTRNRRTAEVKTEQTE